MSSDAITGDRGEALANIREKLDLGKGMGYNISFARCPKAPLAALSHVRDCGQRNTHSEQCTSHGLSASIRGGPKTRVQNPTNLGWNQSPS